jgi:replicative DNA helicase
MDIEYATLCKVIESRGYQTLADARVTPSFFVSEDNAAMFAWMRDHWLKYGESPGEEAFNRAYPLDHLIETPEPLAYYVDELRSSHQLALLTAMLDQAKEPMKNNDGGIVVKLLATGLEGLHQAVDHARDDILTDPQSMEQTLGYYDGLANSTGLLGYSTGFPSMDLATGGLQKGQLITLIGQPKSKKSMLLMCMNIACHQAGASTLYVSFEMTSREQNTRHDALRAGVNLTHLQHGTHTPEERKRLVKMMHGMEDMQPMVLVHDPSSSYTVSALAAKIAQYRPDVIFVDGAYMMDTDDPNLVRNSPQALTSITRSLKSLALNREVCVAQTTQALTWKSKKGRLTLDSIGYSSSFGQDSDVIFGVEDVLRENEPDPTKLRLRIIASRNCSQRDVEVGVYLERGSIMEIEEVNYEEADDDNFGP